jgi:membrane-bound metal-dependent hydrolase YbcI (DUF457 family)
MTMPLAFMHLIVAWMIGKLYEKVTKLKISSKIWFFLLAGAILPDLDHLFDWFLGMSIHRGITHSLFFAITAAILVYVLFRKREFAYALFIGISVHLLLDFLSYGGIKFFWPYQQYISIFGTSLAVETNFFANMLRSLKEILFDLALGVAWFFYFVLNKKLKF